jgi:hypothetical protein
MCTLHLFNAESKLVHVQAIAREWKSNSDGGSVVLMDGDNNVFLRAQCVKLQHLVRLIMTSDAAKYGVHLRASTTQVQGVSGCHWFDSPEGEWIFAHNGIIDNPERHRVDSIGLGYDLDNDRDYPDWSHHDFCNVLAIQQYARCAAIFIHRSYDGNLYYNELTDCWSTNKIDNDYRYVEQAGWYDEGGYIQREYPKRSYKHYMPTRYQYFRQRYNAIHNAVDSSIVRPSFESTESGLIIPTKDSADELEAKVSASELVYCESCQFHVPSKDLVTWQGIEVCQCCMDEVMSFDNSAAWEME